MSDGANLKISDPAGFPGKIDVIKKAAAELRAAGGELAAIAEKAHEEAGSFTADGKPAPIYAPIISDLQKGAEAAKSAIDAVATGTDNCADTAKAKFIGMTDVDDRGAQRINN